MMNYVDLKFPVHGEVIPRDHAYALYGALSRAVPDLHGAEWLAIHGIGARLLGPEMLTLKPSASLRLRVPVDRIGGVLPLAGKSVDIAGRRVVIGPPSVHPLRPAATLDARLVVIRLTGGVKTPNESFVAEAFKARFLTEARRQLTKLGVAGDLEVRGRSSITVGGRRVMGCAVRVSGLSAEHSLTLQVHGIGGKRAMGCGAFRPARGES